MNTLEHLYELVGRAVLYPMPFGTKKLTLKGWQKRTFAETKTPERQKELQDCEKRGGNICVKLGPDLAGSSQSTSTMTICSTTS